MDPVYGITRFLLKVFFKMSGLRLVVSGGMNIPAKGAFILAANHESNLDPVILALASRRQLTFMAKEELFKIPVLGQYIRLLGAFPVRRESGDAGSIKEAVRKLKEGKAMVMFPEGSRGASRGQGFRVKKGVGFISRLSSANVVPVHISGSDKAMPKGCRRVLRSEIKVVFGHCLQRGSYDSDEAASRVVMENILSLS